VCVLVTTIAEDELHFYELGINILFSFEI